MTPIEIDIRPARKDDHEGIWAVLEPIVRAGETYALPREMTRDEALAYWLAADHDAFVALAGNEIVGTSFVRQNQRGGGSHVSNAAYATATAATGKGVARAMCSHSLVHAKQRGFRAMQFNFVVATNERAVSLWQTMGFSIVGRLPGAFVHPTRGEVDALVMYRSL